jgi:hypothetical protein
MTHPYDMRNQDGDLSINEQLLELACAPGDPLGVALLAWEVPAEHQKFEYLRQTSNMAEIDSAVYGDNGLAQSYVGRNANLTEAHCRHLFKKLADPFLRSLLYRLPVFPTDLLMEAALVEEDTFARALIAGSPNADDETQTVIALLGDRWVQ